jgi:nucleotide-binding universal stress UspA family protein
MLTIRKILVSTDFSALSKGAFSYACELARTYHAQLTLLYVFQPSEKFFPEGYMSSTSDEELYHRDEQRLAEARKEIAGQTQAPLDAQIVSGSPHAEILKQARQGGYDLIVLASHGRSGLGHAILGSVAEKVLRQAPCPVLIVKPSEAKAA